MDHPITIAIDAMGGDQGPRVVVPAVLRTLARYPDRVRIILVGDQKLLRRSLRLHRAIESERLLIHHASQVVEMDEMPSMALRKKKDSSMRVSLNLVKSGKAQACVSAGNTGALVATAKFVLKTLPGISRPAIITQLPNMASDAKAQAGTRVLDLGANVDSSPERLFQFAVMGSVLTQAVEGIEKPRVGLLNIGEEQIKGNEQVKETAAMLSQCDAINYIGYVEGDDMFTGVADVIVTDGFVGNVALKAAEGSAKLIQHLMKKAFRKNIFTKISGIIVLPVLRLLRKSIDPARFNGASLVGLRSIVIKSHGSTSVFGYYHAIRVAIREVESDVPQRIRHQVEELLKEEQGNSDSSPSVE